MLITAPDKQNQVKTCQSCIDRQLDNPKPASHQWAKGYWICSECLSYLKLNQANQAGQEPSRPEDSIITSDYILSHRDEFFNNKALAIANLSYDELIQQYENNRIVLFRTNIEQEALQIKIDEYKAQKRRELQVSDKAWDDAHANDKQPSLAVAKIKEEQELKKLKAIAKQTGLTVEQVRELGKQARAAEMQNLANGTKCEKCGQLVCECSKSVVGELKEITNQLRNSIAGETPKEEKPKIKVCPLCKETYEGEWIQHKAVRHS